MRSLARLKKSVRRVGLDIRQVSTQQPVKKDMPKRSAAEK